MENSKNPPQKSDNLRFALLFKHLYCTLTTSQINKALRSAGLSHGDWMDLVQYMKFEDPTDAAAKDEAAECDWCEEREPERKCSHCGFTVCGRCFNGQQCPNCNTGNFKDIETAG